VLLDRLKSLLQDPPPGMAFEISEAGIAAARIGSRAELGFQPLKPGTVSVSPIHQNVADPEEFARRCARWRGRRRRASGKRWR